MPPTPRQIAWRLAYDMGFVPLDKTMFEYWTNIDPSFCPDNRLPEDMQAYRIANSSFPSRVHILIDKDELEWYFVSSGEDEES